MHMIFIVVQLITATFWKQPICPSAEEWYLYTRAYYSSIKKEKLDSFVKWIQLVSLMLNEINQTTLNNTWLLLYNKSKV